MFQLPQLLLSCPWAIFNGPELCTSCCCCLCLHELLPCYHLLPASLLENFMWLFSGCLGMAASRLAAENPPPSWNFHVPSLPCTMALHALMACALKLLP